jgi:hypothetical protein
MTEYPESHGWDKIPLHNEISLYRMKALKSLFPVMA